jgi:hypothetical protein
MIFAPPPPSGSSTAHHSDARQRLTSWRAQQDTVLISVVNLTEVLVAPAADEHRLRTARSAIAALGVTIQQPTEAIAVDAARLSSRHPISLPDSQAYRRERRLVPHQGPSRRESYRDIGRDGPMRASVREPAK